MPSSPEEGRVIACPRGVARKPEGSHFLASGYLAPQARGRRARNDGYARDDVSARWTQRRDGRGCVARADERTDSGSRGPPGNGSRLLQIEAKRAARDWGAYFQHRTADLRLVGVISVVMPIGTSRRSTTC